MRRHAYFLPFLLFVVYSLACHVAPKEPEVILPPRPPKTDEYQYGKFTFWYSPDQRDTLDYLDKPRTFVNINGKLVEYTECIDATQYEPIGRWVDYTLIGTTEAYCKPF